MSLFGSKPAPFFFPWRGEVHDALFSKRDLRFAKEAHEAKLTFWRPEGGSWRSWSGKRNEEILWEGLTVTIRNAESLDVKIREEHECYELSTVFIDPKTSRIVFEAQYAIDVSVSGENLKATLSAPSAPKTWRDVFEPTSP
jgi:hypothetical protein